jgi:outer membrane protein OmpA-like peptidoglycan-associated protein
MKAQKVLIGLLLFTLFNNQLLSQDADGCKEHPMFPNRMSNYFLTECASNFDAVEFWMSADASQTVSREGSKFSLRYDFNTESGQQKPSVLQILRNYENAAKKIGGTTMYFNINSATAVYKIQVNGKEAAWVKVETGGNDSNDFIMVTILELEKMKQEITANDILTALNNEGRIVLYINFETGKADIKAESLSIINEVADMLISNPSVRIRVEGHTDNVGTSSTNKTLSENRARSVVNALLKKSIDQSKLSSQGFGQDKPIADNGTEEGKAKNRRVEIAKVN